MFLIFSLNDTIFHRIMLIPQNTLIDMNIVMVNPARRKLVHCNHLLRLVHCHLWQGIAYVNHFGCQLEVFGQLTTKNDLFVHILPMSCNEQVTTDGCNGQIFVLLLCEE